MADTQLAHQLLRPNATVYGSLRRSSAAALNINPAFPPFKALAYRSLKTKYTKLAVRSVSLNVDQYYCAPKSSAVVDVKRLVDFLYEDLPHVFDDQGIDRTAYDEHVKFSDPITKHESLSGYLFNIAFLKTLFKPQLQLHWVKQTGPHEITARWTVVMEYVLLPWKPELVLTGTSIMGINPETGKFCTHVDLWDSVRENNFFSMEAFWYIIKQMCIYWIYRTPDIGTAKYQILKRMPNYEVRKYSPLAAMEGTEYIFGKNSPKKNRPITSTTYSRYEKQKKRQYCRCIKVQWKTYRENCAGEG
ncbi:uncharacterized protein LOC21408317 isoform X2 [Morus notabilis]|uniref:uncharacterized protein LOC21408317 isoform X2 n=1 Tax=Morus notabilis TaxID=981085 RepID=UPI000CECF32D|nr:uncharacterized protein LOC21408317 isoform X2 [Morus notabilis]